MTQRRLPLTLPMLAAGFVTVLVGFTSSYAIIVQAAQAMGADRNMIISMTLALSVGMGLTTLLPSLWLRMPVVTAWSTPGAALLVVSLQGVSMPDAIGAFLVCGALLMLVGLTGWFERWMDRIPLPLASALLAGVLTRFGLEAFAGLHSALPVVGAMLLTYLIAKRLHPRYAVPWVLVVGMMVLAATGQWHWPVNSLQLSQPMWIEPQWHWPTVIGVGVPLFVVTVASQNVPGVAVLKAHGYKAPISGLIAFTGLVTVILAPMGVFALNLAAITAAICMGEEVDAEPGRRFMAAVVAGLLYILVGVFAASVVDLFTSFPREMVIAVAGLALLPTIARGLSVAMHDEVEREPALITFLMTASGATVLGLGSAFWGIVLGVGARWIWVRSVR